MADFRVQPTKPCFPKRFSSTIIQKCSVRTTAAFGAPLYTRIDTPATVEQKSRLGKLSPDAVSEKTLAGDPITAKLSHAPGNGAAIGGLKVTTDDGWFAARPSGTEDLYKLYAESFRDQAHLDRIVAEAGQIVSNALHAQA